MSVAGGYIPLTAHVAFCMRFMRYNFSETMQRYIFFDYDINRTFDKV